VLFFAQQGVGIGVGGMERVAVLPFPLWACCLGVLLAEKQNPAPARVDHAVVVPE
jgi:hypothetical protein